MKYKEKYNLFRTKASLVDENGRVVATGAQIREFAPSAVKYAYGEPIYIIDDKNGNMSIYSSSKDAFILTQAQTASPELVCEGSPILFTKEGKTLYVNPTSSKVFHIPDADTICFERDSMGMLTHNGVFQVHDGIPYPLNIEGRRGDHITRYPQQDTVENVYAPLLLASEDSVITYLGSHTDKDYRHLAQTYATLEGEKHLATFLPSITKHFTKVVSQNGVYSPKRIKELREVELARTQERDEKHEKINKERSTINSRMEEIKKELQALGQPDYTENELRYLDNKERKVALKHLEAAKAAATPEVAALYEEREALIKQSASYVGSSRVQSLEDDEIAAENYLYGLRIKEETYVQIGKVDSLFETIEKEQGLKPTKVAQPAEEAVVEEVVETVTNSQARVL